MLRQRRNPVPISFVCEVLNLAQPKYVQWCQQGVVTHAEPSSTTLAQALELAVAASLVPVLRRLDRARKAMGQLRPRLRSIRAKSLKSRLDIVLDLQLGTAVWVTRNDELARAVRTGRACRVLPMAELLSTVYGAYSLEAKDRLLGRSAPRLRVIKRHASGA